MPAATLEQILQVTRDRVAALQGDAPDLARRAAAAPPPRPFLPVPLGRTVGVVAEIKRRSPSQGSIRNNLDPVSHARAYARGGAVAISVLTDEAHFGGSLADLSQVAAAVSLPVLRKDFIIDETQILEARAAGASAVLLIVRVLPAAVGVNARDLTTFTVDLRAAEAVVARVPPAIPVVAESGIEDRTDVERLAAAGADFVLVGTSLARRSDPEAAVRALTGVPRHPRSSS